MLLKFDLIWVEFVDLEAVVCEFLELMRSELESEVVGICRREMPVEATSKCSAQ